MEENNFGKVMAKALVASLLAIVILLTGIYYYDQTSHYLKLTGIIQGEVINYKANTDGSIIKWALEPKAQVEANTLVVTVNSKINPEQLKALEDNYAKAKEEFNILDRKIKGKYGAATVSISAKDNVKTPDNEQLQEKINILTRQLQQMANLVASGAVSNQEYKRAKDKLAQLQSQLQSNNLPTASARPVSTPEDKEINDFAQAQIKYLQLEQALNQAKGQNELSINAPVSGELVKVFFPQGGQFKTGDNLFAIDTGKNLSLYVKIPKEAIEQVHLGQYLTYKVKDQQYDGLITALEEDDKGELVAKISLPKELQVNSGQEVKVIISK